ncbi:MAG: ribbon-helix-helix protein, CopG family [Candidatus Heimdallarchaeota archaeon]|nr:ribbon-helix-helix protein, CopG family [Candidatus Heimdallarchaeota archaeon]
MPVVSLSIENELLHKFTDIIEREGFKSKSEAFRLALHDFVLKYQFSLSEGNELVEMIIGFSYIESLKMRNILTALQHEYKIEIKETLHRHIFNNICFDLVFLHGIRQELQPLVNRIRATKGIESFYVSTVNRENPASDSSVRIEYNDM